MKGDNTLVIRDVVVGEVWFASGHSNMEWTLNVTGAQEEPAPFRVDDLPLVTRDVGH